MRLEIGARQEGREVHKLMYTLNGVRAKLSAQLCNPGRSKSTRMLVQKVARKQREVLKKLVYDYQLGLASVTYRFPQRARLVFLINSVPFGPPLAHHPDRPRVDFEAARRQLWSFL